MTMNNGEEPEMIDLNTNPDRLEDFEEDDTLAFKVASWTMQEFDPGFVIIGSPDMALLPSGMMYPNSIGIVLNDRVGVTKTILASILLEVAHQLGTDMAKVEKFLKEALNNDGE